MEKNPLTAIFRERYFFPVLFVLLVILRISGLYQPILDIDESVFAEFANKLLTGSLPYSEVFDNKPPGTYYLFAAIFSVAGLSNLYAVHVVTTLIVFFTTAGLYFIARNIHGRSAAVLTVLFYVFMTHTYEPKYISTNGEILINFPLVISVLCYFRGRNGSGKSLWWFAGAGLMLGCAVLINYKAGFCSLIFAADTILVRWLVMDRSRKVFLREAVSLAVTGFSSMLPVIAAAFYFYRIGVLSDFINWGFLYNFRYIDSGAASTPLWKTALRSTYFLVSTLPVWLVIAAFLFRKKKKFPSTGEHRAEIIFIYFWLGVSAAAALLGGRTYGHYFIQIAPPASLLAGFAASRLAEKGLDLKLLKASAVLSIAITLLFFISRISIDTTYRLIRYDNWNVMPVFSSAGEYVRRNTAESDSIYVWGWGTPVYIYANRRCSSKVLLANYISGKSFGSSRDYRVTMDQDFLVMMREAFMKEFISSPPELFLDTEKTGFFGYDRFPVKVFPELYNYLRENYKFETVISGVDIYRRVR